MSPESISRIRSLGRSTTSRAWVTNPIRAVLWWLIKPYIVGTLREAGASTPTAPAPEVMALAQQLAAERKDMAALAQRLAGERKDMAALAQRLAGLEAECDAIQRSLIALRADCEARRGELAGAQDEARAAARAVASLTTKFRSEVGALRDAMASLPRSNAP